MLTCVKFETGKPVKAEQLSEIESIVNEQIKAELDVFSKEAKLLDAKSINGLRAVFGEVSFKHLFSVCEFSKTRTALLLPKFSKIDTWLVV